MGFVGHTFSVCLCACMCYLFLHWNEFITPHVPSWFIHVCAFEALHKNDCGTILTRLSLQHFYLHPPPPLRLSLFPPLEFIIVVKDFVTLRQSFKAKVLECAIRREDERRTGEEEAGDHGYLMMMMMMWK